MNFKTGLNIKSPSRVNILSRLAFHLMQTSFMLRTRFSIPGLLLLLLLLGKESLNDYVLVNLKLDQALFKGKADLYVGVDNLFDVDL